MKIFTSKQLRDWDAYTIKADNLTSIELMDKAAEIFCEWFQIFQIIDDLKIEIFCGSGNNGGDGIAIAKILKYLGCDVKIWWCKTSAPTPDFFHQLNQLPDDDSIPVFSIKEDDPLPKINKKAIVIDAIFGTGLTRSIKGYWATLIEHININGNIIYSVDMPSGMFSDFYSEGICINANKVCSFEVPKLAFFMRSNEERIRSFYVESLDLNQKYYLETVADYQTVEEDDIFDIFKIRSKFAHKGDFGHALLVVGKEGSMGAAILASKSCMRSGVGKCTVHTPRCGRDVLQISVPEVMLIIDKEDTILSQSIDYNIYDAIGVGCGIGTHQLTATLLAEILTKAKKPLVLDADALNIIAQNQELLSFIPKGTIITPHPKEFERLFGHSPNEFMQLEIQKQKSMELGIIIVLKGHHTVISDVDGLSYINTNGNDGMATAGSGDVLTGIITSFLAQQYLPIDAAKLGVYLHGLAGDIALSHQTQETLIASDLIKHFHEAFDDIKIGSADYPF